MAQQIVCDFCKVIKDERGSLGWWQIEPLGEYLESFGQPEPPYQFCSWECVGLYAADPQRAHGIEKEGRG